MSKLKELGQYPTPAWVAEALVDRYFCELTEQDLVLEPTCGPGAFLSAIPAHVPAIGVELDSDIAEQARVNTGRSVIVGDFRTVTLDIHPTVIIGNPPFNLHVIDGILARAHSLLPEEGRVGFLLPAYTFQTAARVAGYADNWSLSQEMVPRNIYPGLRLPLMFAMFIKDRLRSMVGFALYRETADVHKLPAPYKEVLARGSGSAWRAVTELALARLGGSASIASIYAELEGVRPTQTKFWREKIRQTLRRYEHRFNALGDGHYSLIPLAA
ncbi:MAG: class I SAM-dependent methyltransferase [Candidatus Nanopelagicales bacterium]